MTTEVMVELVGPVKQFGVKSTLEALDQLKEEYAPTGGETSTEQEEAEHRLEQMLRAIAASPVHMRLRGEGPCDVSVWSDNESADSPGVTIEWQMLRAANVVAGVIPAREEDAHTFAEVPLEQVTPFILVTGQERFGHSPDDSARETPGRFRASTHGSPERAHHRSGVILAAADDDA